VVGYDVIGDRTAALESLGGRAAPSATAVAAASGAICVVLPSLDTVETVVLGPDGLAARGAPSRTILQMSTISPSLTRTLAREAGAAIPLTDVAERLYARAQAAGHGPEDLAVVVRALEA